MVNVTLDNKTVSIVFGSNENVTVPTGETWKASITMSPADTNLNSDQAGISINGVSVLSTSNGRSSEGGKHETILKGGDTIGWTGGCCSRGAHIGAIVIS